MRFFGWLAGFHRYFDDSLLRWRAYRSWRSDRYDSISSLERQLADERAARRDDRKRFESENRLLQREIESMAKILENQDARIDASTSVHARTAAEAGAPARPNR